MFFLFKPRKVSAFRKDVRKNMFSVFTKLISQGLFSKNTKFRCSRVAVKVLCFIKVLQDCGTAVSAVHLLRPENSVSSTETLKIERATCRDPLRPAIYVQGILQEFSHAGTVLCTGERCVGSVLL